MQLTLRQQITQFAHVLQSQLFPALEEANGELDATARRLVTVLEMIPLGRFVPTARGWVGGRRRTVWRSPVRLWLKRCTASVSPGNY